MDPPRVRSASDDDRAGVLGVITLAFSNDPFARWVLPEPATYLSVMPQGALAFGGNGFAAGTVDCLESCAGAAMWLPPGVEPDAERLIGLFETHAPRAVLADLLAVFEEMSRYHPEGPHWYLPLIGVDPARQGLGLGSVLMRHALERCDAEGLPAYLESSNPRNIPLYLRHGFEVIGTIQVGTSPEMFPMLRAPR